MTPMLKSFLILDKQVGETPLECMNRFKEMHPEYADQKMTYAGRLDPMANGVLLVLVGEMVHKKDDYLKLPKSYECTAILGIETDTYDVLGIPVSPSLNKEGVDTPFRRAEGGGKIEEVLYKFTGTFSQPYPPYSSKTINGKQMHTLARQGGLEHLEIPQQMVTVDAISNIHMTTVEIPALIQEIIESVKKVNGDFRQEETITAWETIQREHSGKKLDLMTFSVDVSGGTYIRGIVHELGRQLGVGACILRLKRTSVGDYRLLDK